jgi:SAM-dependent methyltransferase
VVICNQVIEHVISDERLAREIAKLLKPDGVAYIFSVLKLRGAIWLYRRKEEFRLDPTHVREYSSLKNFVNVLRKGGLRVVELRTSKFEFPLFHLVLRIMIRARLLSSEKGRLSTLKAPIKASISPPGYYLVECLAVKQPCTK